MVVCCWVCCGPGSVLRLGMHGRMLLGMLRPGFGTETRHAWSYVAGYAAARVRY